MRWLLNAAYASVFIAVSPVLAWRALRTGRYRHSWPERLLGQVPELPTGVSCIWFHGVSLGEVQLLTPLLLEFRARHPQHTVVLSTSTMTGLELARKSLPNVITFTCPWDFSWAMRRAVNRLRPALIVLGELELWPNWVALAAERGVPIAIVNGRLSDRSYRGYARGRMLLTPTFQRLSLVAAQDESSAARFRSLGVDPIALHVTGSLKVDNVVADRQHDEVVARAQMVGLSPQHHVLIVGSTQAPEEAASVAAVQRLLTKHPGLKLIVVPRHPERFDEVSRILQQSGMDVLRRSQLSTPVSADAWQVLLVDSVGELKWWWGLAELALVGGSFGDRGGQNMLEPAAYGAKVAFGPNTRNFRTIVSALLEKEAAWELPNLDALESWIDDQLTDPASGFSHTERAKQWIATQQGATERTYELLTKLLQPSG